MRTVKGLSDGDRLLIIHEHLAGTSKISLARKYNLHDGRIILKWMRIFGIAQSPKAAIMKKEDEPQEILRLEKELQELKATLAYERMRADAYDTMISLAEKEFQIPIRKKIWHQTVNALWREDKRYKISPVCSLFGVTGQSYYQRQEKDFLRQAIKKMIVYYVQRVR